jgi:hypothetical protein
MKRNSILVRGISILAVCALALAALGRCSWLAAVSRLALIVSITLAALSAAHAQPRITTQPKDQFLGPGQSAMFSVVALGTPPLSYRWFYQGAPLADATNSSVRLTNVQSSLNGQYFVVMSDGSGSVTSQVARLKVFVPTPHSFDNITVKPGEVATLALAGETTARLAPYCDLYPLEVSSGLVAWSLLATLQRPNTALARLTFADTNASQFSQRFYRTPTNLLITPFPMPTGPFAVGTFSRVISDPARTNLYRYNKKTNSFMFTCWYPAELQAGLLPAAVWDNKLARDWSTILANVTGDSSWTSVVPQFRGHALPEAPAVRGTNRYPIILHSHGYSAHRKSNSRDMEELASHGYVVVAVDHEDCWGTEFPDGRYLTTPYPSLAVDPVAAYLIDSRIKDLLCVMDELRRMDANDPWLAGRLDLNCLGTLGWSFGGSSTGNLCRTNEAVKCAAFLDCAFHFEVDVELKQTGLQKPFLAMNNDYAADQSLYFWPESTHLFDLAQAKAIIFQIRNTSHFSFADQGWFFPVTVPYAPPTPGGSSRVIDACLVSFFNKYLKGQDDHFLDQAPPKYPSEIYEVFNFKRK